VRGLPSERPYTPESGHNSKTTIWQRVADNHLCDGSCNQGYCAPDNTRGCRNCMLCTYREVKCKPKRT
jgi:hypothetical protein